MKEDSTNERFDLAVELVNKSSRNIFLTGKAGTGKTTFLRYIREHCPKQLAIVAPTGVAAINAGGVTIHSFFQLPMLPFVPDANYSGREYGEVANPHTLISRQRINRDKLKVLQELELLVIDEVSMLRSDTLDAIDTVLRHARKRPSEAFGGVQVLFIGDLFQLPPVVRDETRGLFADYYSGPYFFDSLVIRDHPPLYLEFEKIYRQSEERFINLLNKIRNNEVDQDELALLETLYRPTFLQERMPGYIILTTHTDRAKQINAQELQRLEAPLFSFRAEIKNEFPDKSYPAEEILQLKQGAQVMFIRNDSDRDKRYFNGKIGVVTEIDKDKILVKCEGDEDAIEVKPEKWDNIRYTVNSSSRKMEEELMGSFAQYPLRLAWAITIHKSQGLTFERAIIDAGNAFAAGQIYVALSRCTTLEGLVLLSRINTRSLLADERIIRFSNSQDPSRLSGELLLAKTAYEKQILSNAFDLRLSNDQAQEIVKYLHEQKKSFNEEALSWGRSVFEKINILQETAMKFNLWMDRQFEGSGSASANPVLQERCAKAADHFVTALATILSDLRQSPAVTDSRLRAKEYNEMVRELFSELAAKKFFLEEFSPGIDSTLWQERRKGFVGPNPGINAYAGTANVTEPILHPALYRELKNKRDAICSAKNIPVFFVASSKTLEEMVRYLPQTATELMRIKGFGKIKVEKYGEAFLEPIVAYCTEQGLTSNMPDSSFPLIKKTTVRSSETNTLEETLQLYKEGLSIEDIAARRSLTRQTIEKHLTYYLEKGTISIDNLVSADKLAAIEPMMINQDRTFTAILEELGPDVSFGELRLVRAWLLYKNGADQ